MYHDLFVVQSVKMLQNLSAFLDKAVECAAAKKFDSAVLLNSRLAPDQFTLTRQIQIACDTAKLAAARLTNKVDAAPQHPDTEQSIEALQARISSVIAYLQSFADEDFKNAATQVITQPRWEGKTLTGEQFALQHAVPNLYFHITTAYAILRHNGVELGKKDFLGPMPYALP
jgi:hypothetical protein